MALVAAVYLGPKSSGKVSWCSVGSWAIRPLLNPVVVFPMASMWGWFWVGSLVLMTVPLLAILEIICDHIEPPVLGTIDPNW